MNLQDSLAIFQDSTSTLPHKRDALRGLLAAIDLPDAPKSQVQKAKNLIKFFPPIRQLLIRRYEKQFAQVELANLFRGVFESFEQAEASAPPTKQIGYDHEGPASMYRGHLEQVHTMEYPTLLWMASLLKEGKRVFDFGGHIGVAFYGFSKYLEYPEGLEWTVYDMPAVTRAGAQVAQERSESRIRFTQDVADASGADVFHASGSLQYNPNTPGTLLSKLAKKPRHIVINKQPLAEGPGCFTLQNIGTAFCPYRIYNRDEFVRSIESQGYELVDQWRTPFLRCEIPYHAQYSDIRYFGFYFRAKA